MRPVFPECGACELIISARLKGGSACELKISKFGDLRGKIWAKIEVLEAKISFFFLERGACELTFA